MAKVPYIPQRRLYSMEGNDALRKVSQHLLDEHWYVADPLCAAQVNAIVVDEILTKYAPRRRAVFRWLSNLWCSFITFQKEVKLMMAMLFATRVILGKTSFAEVPEKLKAAVAENLLDNGLPELVPAEFGGTAQ